MTTFLPGRAGMLAIVVWSGYVAAWAALTASGPSIAAVWWLAGVTLLQAVARLQRPRRDAND